MRLGLEGKRALVLAASRGLGYASASALAREGCKLTVCSRDTARIQSAATAIHAETGAEVHPVAADVSQPGTVERVVAAAVSAYGGLEIVVHNAGGPPAGEFDALSDAQWAAALEANLLSFVRLVRAAAPEVRKAGYGRVIAIASSSIKQPIPGLAISNAFRAGVLGTAKTLSKELASDGILVNVVAPGRIATERIDELDRARAEGSGQPLAAVRAAALATIPLGRLGRPEELANLVVFLASEAASYITGAAIQVDGGMIAVIP